MKRFIPLVVIFVLVAVANSFAQESVDTLIVGGHVFNTESGTFEKNSGLAIAEGKFKSVQLGEKQVEPNRRVELGDNQYILPGLIDCHAHYNVKLIRKRREEYLAMPVVYLANGVTVTFSCGEFDPEQMMKLRKDIDAGRKVGPKLLNSGPYFGRARPGWRGEKPEQDIRDEVDFWAKQGVGGFKAKAINARDLKILVDQAHKHGLTVTGHLDSGFRGSVNPRDAINIGIDRIEHFLGGDAMPSSRSAYSSLAKITSDMPEYKRIVDLYLEKKTWFDATLTAYGYFGVPGEEYDHWIDERQFFTPYIQELVKKRPASKPMMQFDDIYRAKLKTIGVFHKAGGQISLGTDHFSNGNWLPGFGAHRELDAFVRAGISEVDALRIGTINGAKALKIEKDHGSIETGKSADLFIVTGNPLENIRNTRNVEWVMTRGQLHKSADLLESVKGKLGPENQTQAKDW